MELYSHDKYKGYHLFVECLVSDEEEYPWWEGVAQMNGNTYFESKSQSSGSRAEEYLIAKIDTYLEGEE
jgi:hypothetical protein